MYFYYGCYYTNITKKMQDLNDNVIRVPIDNSIGESVTPCQTPFNTPQLYDSHSTEEHLGYMYRDTSTNYINFYEGNPHNTEDYASSELSTNFDDFIKEQEASSSKEQSKAEFYNFVNESDGKVRVNDTFNPSVCEIKNVSVYESIDNTILDDINYKDNNDQNKVECFDPRGDIFLYKTQ